MAPVIVWSLSPRATKLAWGPGTGSPGRDELIGIKFPPRHLSLAPLSPPPASGPGLGFWHSCQVLVPPTHSPLAVLAGPAL